MLPHHVMLRLLCEQALRECAHAGRRRGFVDEMEAGLAGLGDQRADALEDDVGAGSVVAADVVERHVAEAALLPVAAVRERDLVPAAVGPEPMHRVQHLDHRYVVRERQAVVRRDARVALCEVGLRGVGFEHDAIVAAHVGAHERHPFALQSGQEIQERPFAVVEHHVVEVIEYSRLAQRAQLGVDPTAAEHERRARRNLSDRFGHGERAVDVAGERRGHADDVRSMRRDELARELRERFVDERRLAVERRRERLERRCAGRELLAVARELEVRVDAEPPDVGEIVDEQAREIARLIGRAEAAERPGERIVAGADVAR